MYCIFKFSTVYIYFSLRECLPVCMYVHMHGWCLWRSEEGILSPGSEVTVNSASFHVGAKNSTQLLWNNSSSVLNSLQPKNLFLYRSVNHKAINNNSGDEPHSHWYKTVAYQKWHQHNSLSVALPPFPAQ